METSSKLLVGTQGQPGWLRDAVVRILKMLTAGSIHFPFVTNLLLLYTLYSQYRAFLSSRQLRPVSSRDLENPKIGIGFLNSLLPELSIILSTESGFGYVGWAERLRRSWVLTAGFPAAVLAISLAEVGADKKGWVHSVSLSSGLDSSLYPLVSLFSPGLKHKVLAYRQEESSQCGPCVSSSSFQWGSR